MRKLTRSIYFYKVNIAKYEKEPKNQFVESTDFKNDIKNIFDNLKILKYDKQNLEESLYERKYNGTYDFVTIEEIDDKHICGKLINTDDSGLTYYEKNGILKPLNKNIAEVSHFYINLETQIMAFEYNSKCSHASSLSSYLCNKCKNLYRISFVNLQNKRTLERFNKIKHISKFEFKTSSKLLEINKAAKTNKLFIAVGATYDLTNNSSDVDQMITLKIKNKSLSKKQKKEKQNPFFSAEQLKEDLASITNLTEDKDFLLDITGYSELNEKIRVNYFRDLITGSITIEDDKSSATFYAKLKDCYFKTYKEYIS